MNRYLRYAIRYSYFFLLLLTLPVAAQESMYSDTVFARATRYHQPVLLVFSGSDWCAGCIRLHKKVISDTAFIHFADKHFQIITADFPQRKKLSATSVKQNEALAERYNPNGVFPYLVLIDESQKQGITIPADQSKGSGLITAIQDAMTRLGYYD
jgi:thioredoxin-related protein